MLICVPKILNSANKILICCAHIADLSDNILICAHKMLIHTNNTQFVHKKTKNLENANLCIQNTHLCSENANMSK